MSKDFYALFYFIFILLIDIIILQIRFFLLILILISICIKNILIFIAIIVPSYQLSFQGLFFDYSYICYRHLIFLLIKLFYRNIKNYIFLNVEKLDVFQFDFHYEN